jgi:hypothetical protein
MARVTSTSDISNREGRFATHSRLQRFLKAAVDFMPQADNRITRGCWPRKQSIL